VPYSVVLDLEDGGQVIYDNVISCTIEEAEEPSPDEVPEEGEEEREGNEEPDMSEYDKNPMYEEDDREIS
jgi:hypothetical protein